MKLRISSYILVVFSIFLFIVPLYIGNSAITDSTKVIANIQEELLDMVELTYAIDHNVYKHRNALLEKIVKNQSIDLKIEGFDLDENIALVNITSERMNNAQKAPPYSTLSKIAGALGVEVTQMFEKNIEPLDDIRISFHKACDSKIIKATSQFSGYDYQVLAPDKPGKNMEPFIIYSPKKITKMYSHEGEEFIYVMDGSLEFVYGEDTYILEKGDHIYFDSCIPHAGKSIGKKKAMLMVVIYFYKRNRR